MCIRDSRKGQKAVFQFLYDSNGKNLSHRLFFTGQSALFYFWKAENDCNMLYSNIEDALDSSNANLSTYCLNFTNRKETSYQKMVFKKITWPVKMCIRDRYTWEDLQWNIQNLANEQQYDDSKGWWYPWSFSEDSSYPYPQLSENPYRAFRFGSGTEEAVSYTHLCFL